LRCTEISERGHVHLHSVYYGPPVTAAWLEKVGKKVSQGRGCRAKVQKIKGGAAGVKKAARYAAKSVKGSAGAFNEDALTGEGRVSNLYPELAARWELAAANLRLSDVYGALRGIEVPKVESEGGPHDDSETQCSCGAVGRFRTSYRNVFDFLIECHLKGQAGLEGNKWLPYWMRDAVRRKKLRLAEEKARKRRLARMRAQSRQKKPASKRKAG